MQEKAKRKKGTNRPNTLRKLTNTMDRDILEERKTIRRGLALFKAFAKTLALLGILVLVVFLWFFFGYWRPYEDKQVVDFKNQFGIQLPHGAQVLYSESDFGWMGDGYAVLAVAIPPEEMPAVERQVAGSWSELPTPMKFASPLYERGLAFMDEEAATWFRCFQQSGCYRVQNRKGLPLRGDIHGDDSFNDIAWAVLDTEENRLYYLTWKM